MRHLCAAIAILTGTTVAAQADIISTIGLDVIAAPSVTITADFLINNGLPPQIIFPEQQNVTLLSPLSTDTGIIPAGSVVNSYFLALNIADCCVNTNANTSVTFDGAVLGVVYLANAIGIPSPNYATTDFLGAPNTIYQEALCFWCGFETFQMSQQLTNFDAITSISGNTISFHNLYSQPGDFARIIAAPVPGPIVGAGIPGLIVALLGMLGLRTWRRQRI